MVVARARRARVIRSAALVTVQQGGIERSITAIGKPHRQVRRREFTPTSPPQASPRWPIRTVRSVGTRRRTFRSFGPIGRGIGTIGSFVSAARTIVQWRPVAMMPAVPVVAASTIPRTARRPRAVTFPPRIQKRQRRDCRHHAIGAQATVGTHDRMHLHACSTVDRIALAFGKRDLPGPHAQMIVLDDAEALHVELGRRGRIERCVRRLQRRRDDLPAVPAAAYRDLGAALESGAELARAQIDVHRGDACASSRPHRAGQSASLRRRPRSRCVWPRWTRRRGAAR